MVSELLHIVLVLMISLNPCCCGRWSQRFQNAFPILSFHVLILVVVEDGLRGKFLAVRVKNPYIVLILVVVEDGLRAFR